jgi:hypothetical protein
MLDPEVPKAVEGVSDCRLGITRRPHLVVIARLR